jgi:hypothetical protein
MNTEALLYAFAPLIAYALGSVVTLICYSYAIRKNG